MNRRETLVVPETLEWRETRVQTEVAVEVDQVLRGNRDARPLFVIQRIAVRDDHVQSVHGAALEEANEDRAVGRLGGWAVRCQRGSSQEQRIEAEAQEREASRLHEYAPRDRHCLWNSGPPSARPTAKVRACAGSFTSASCSRMIDRV